MLRFIKKLFTGKPKADIKALVQQGAVIIDVRTPREFKEGHIENSLNYSLDTLKSHIPELKKKNKPVITVCRSGARSGVGQSMLKDHGVEAYNGGPWTRVASLLHK
ncbi:MAG: rhodanese-like domain-containing protein [Chitinophagaceae bacterium]|nr:rhodanese-like domain-containing protein [Chitinophagaceae bacterium]